MYLTWCNSICICANRLSGIYSYILCNITLSDMVSGPSYLIFCWQSIWHDYIYIFWHAIWHLFWHSVWRLFWRPTWYSIWYLFGPVHAQTELWSSQEGSVPWMDRVWARVCSHWAGVRARLLSDTAPLVLALPDIWARCCPQWQQVSTRREGRRKEQHLC